MTILYTPLSRRQWIGGSVALSTTLLSGCLAARNRSEPESVWGRYGFSDGRFIKPRAMAIDADDHLFIVDTTGRIQVFDGDGNFLRNWKTPQTENGRPTGMTIRRAADGRPDRLLVADTHYYRMLSYSLDGALHEGEQIGGTPGFAAGQFAFVTDVVCDARGCFYIGEYGDSDRIQKFDPDGAFLAQWGSSGSEPEQFVRPQSLAIQGDIIWVADAGNHRIQRFDISKQTPELIDVIGREGSGRGEFHYPYDLAFAADGTIIVCEYGNQRLQRLSADGKWIAFWGGPGFQPGQLYDPWAVVVDSRDRIHVLDSNNHRVQRLMMFG
ncbi:NHL repeat-containing protein [Novipirellula artificiosorum]|uniref:NHL repeat protein n=1 Tax=Novipirellula artificiosorum TaxID=2528016 RepID=A0A5C6DSJ7_9BACT|nr:NHL repeat-containing protein [Novipirellula artificiosorum]TWU39184.1 NHL repeat protein [Novipirellula artificiosorum]